MSCNICYRKTSYFARCKVSLPDPEKSLWRWKLSTLIDEWHAGISQLNDFRKKRADMSCDSQRILQAMVRGGILWKSLESTKYECKLQGIPDQFLCILWDSHWLKQETEIEVHLRPFNPREICVRQFIHVPHGNHMRLLGLCSLEQRNNQILVTNLHRFCEKWWQQRNDQTKMERIWENQIFQNKETKNQKQLQAIGYFRPPVLLLFLTKTGGTMRWALRLYQNRSWWLNEKLLRFCASHFSGCTRPGKNGVGGKIPWRRQWIDGLYAICINLIQSVTCTYW